MYFYENIVAIKYFELVELALIAFVGV